MKSTRLIPVTCAALIILTPAKAQTIEPGRALAETLFATMDQTGRGAIHAGDLEDFRDSVFAGMDSDQSRGVTYREFADWDPGFRQIATNAGRESEYATASRVVFAFWDRDGDGSMSEPEMRTAMSADFRRADLDDDGLLTEAEFIQGFPIMVAMRAAIRPDL